MQGARREQGFGVESIQNGRIKDPKTPGSDKRNQAKERGANGCKHALTKKKAPVIPFERLLGRRKAPQPQPNGERHGEARQHHDDEKSPRRTQGDPEEFPAGNDGFSSVIGKIMERSLKFPEPSNSF